MKYKFKSSNYVVHVRRNSEAGKVIKNDRENESLIARTIIESLETKTKKLENTRNIFINLMAWGLLFSSGKILANKSPEAINNIFPYIYGVTALCASMGIVSQASIRKMEKKKDMLYKIYRKVENKPHKESTISEIKNKKNML